MSSFSQKRKLAVMQWRSQTGPPPETICLGPFLRYQCRWLSPRLFHQCLLEPFFSEVGMLGNNQLKSRNVLLSELQQQFEQPAHRLEVGIGLGLLHRAIGVAVDLLGWEVDLGWLVNQQEARNRAIVLCCEQMQGK